MKRILLSLAVAATALTAGATDYQGSFSNNVGGQTSSLTGTVSVEDNGDGTSTVTIRNYAYQLYGQTYYVGNVQLTGVKTTKVGNVTMLEAVQNVDITAGDNDIYTWQGPSYSALCGGGVPVVFKGEVRGEKITAAFNLDTYQAIRRRIKATFGDDRYTIGQMLGSDFETWHKASNGKTESDEPDGWHSFMSATGSMASAVNSNVSSEILDNDVRPGSTGSKSLKIKSNMALGIVPANGTVTNGRLFAGSPSASNTANNSTSDPSSADVDAKGDPFFTALSSRPDSIGVWVKFSQGTLSASKKDFKYATISAIINDGTTYQDPEDKTYTSVVAKAKNATIEQTNGEWKYISVPFDYASYTTNGVEPKAILVTMSTNAEPGTGSNDKNNPDVLCVDDLSLIYNAKLNSVKIAGTEVPGFSKDTYFYDGLSHDGELSLDDIEFEVGAQGAYVNKYISRTKKGYATVTITVTSGDLKTVNGYTFEVKEVLPEPQVTYTDNLAITLNGMETDPSQATIVTTEHEDGTYDLMLQKFSFGDLLIGDVTIANVVATDVDGWTVYSAEQDAAITNGGAIANALGGKVHVTLNAQSKDGKLYAEISLPVTIDNETMDVFAVFGEKPETAINGVNDSTKAAVAGVYSLSGAKLQKMQKGVNIVRLSDGKTVKVVRK